MSKSILHSIFHPSAACVSALVLLTTPLLAAPASTKTYNQSFSANGAGTITVPDFNTSAGTLDSITLTLSIGNTSGVYVPTTQTNLAFTTNQSGLDTIILGSGNVPSQGNSPGNSGHGAGPTSGNTSTPNTVNTPQVGPGDTTQGHPHETPFANSLSTESIVEHLTPSQFAAWENQNGGNVNLNYADGNISVAGTNFGNNAFAGLTGTEKVKVSYTFTPQVAPEPAGKYLTALAAGVLAFLLLRRRRIIA